MPPGRWQRLGEHLSLTSSQRRILIILLAMLIGYVGIRYAMNPVYIDAPQPIEGDRASELADRLDPNNATVDELAALPGLGKKRAEALVAWRDHVKERDKTATPFHSINDLLFINGFGHAMVDAMAPYLAFPTAIPATQK